MARPKKFDPAIIAQALADCAAGMPTADVVLKYGISQPTLYRAQVAVRKGGLEALTPPPVKHKSPGDRTTVPPKAPPAPPTKPVVRTVNLPPPSREPELLPYYSVPDVLDGTADRQMIMEAARTAANVMASCRASLAVCSTFPKSLQACTSALKDALQIYSVTRGITLESGAAPVFAHASSTDNQVQVQQAIYFVPAPSIDSIPPAAREALAAFRNQEPDVQAA